MKKFLFLFAFLCLISFNSSAQKIGGKVKVLDFGTWISGTLLAIKDGQYFVTFDDKYYKDRLVKEKDIVFIDAVITTKTARDTVYQIKRDTIVIKKIKRDTVFNYRVDTVSIFKSRRDTVFSIRHDTLTVFKTIKDTIVKYKHDTIVINRTIKDTVYNIKKETINTTPAKINPYRLGDLVLAYQDGEWKPAVIIKINTNDTYTVKFDGSSDYYNKVIGIGSLKLRNPAITETPVFRLGDLVQVYDDTEWKPAVIIKISTNDTYTVKFDGSSDYYNKVVGVGSIKPR